MRVTDNTDFHGNIVNLRVDISHVCLFVTLQYLLDLQLPE